MKNAVIPCALPQRMTVFSSIRVKDGKINAVDEYWNDDNPAPQWRLDMGIGTIIEQEERK